GSGSRAAVGLNDVAVDPNRAFSKCFLIGDRAKRPTDQSLNFQGAARLFSTCGFALGAFLSSPRKHAVFAGDPTLAGAFQKLWHPVIDRCRADDARFTELDEDTALRCRNKIRRDLHRTHLVRSTTIDSRFS